MRPITAGAALASLCLLAFVGCSSAPKVAPETYVTRNKAASYVALADDLARQGQFESAITYYRQGIDANSSVDYLEGTALAHHSLGRLYLTMGDRELAGTAFERSADYARLAASAFATSLAAAGRAEVAILEGDLEAATDLLEAAVAAAGSREDALAIALHDRAALHFAQGDAAGATADLERAAAINQKQQRWSELASNRYLLARARLAAGDEEGATSAAEEALLNDKKAENSIGIVADLAFLAELALRRGDAAAAYWYWRRSFDAALGANLGREALRAATALVRVAEGAGRGAELAEWGSVAAKLAPLGKD